MIFLLVGPVAEMARQLLICLISQMTSALGQRIKMANQCLWQQKSNKRFVVSNSPIKLLIHCQDNDSWSGGGTGGSTKEKDTPVVYLLSDELHDITVGVPGTATSLTWKCSMMLNDTSQIYMREKCSLRHFNIRV